MAAPAQPDPLRDLYRALSGAGALPLEPDHPWYVPIHADDPARDPILRLWQRLDLAESESVHLLTGFRGNGKSTELRRLRKLLHEETGARVFLVDMLDSLLMTKPLEPSDFVLSLMTAFARVEDQLRNDLLPLAEADARWLARIHAGKEPSLPSTADLSDLARFLDGNLIMNYLNGEPWYDVHPLLIPELERQQEAATPPAAAAAP